MTRDFDLIREILFQVEKSPSGEPLQFLSFKHKIDDAVVGEHLQLMIEADLIDGEVLSLRPVSFVIKRLTWTGQDFVSNARNDTVWRRVMADAKAKGTSVTMSVLNGLLTKGAQKYAGLG